MRGKPIQGLTPVTVVMAANADVADTYAFPGPGEWELVGVSEVHDVAGTGGACTLDVKKCASGTSIASGTSMLASTFDLESTADTVVKKTVSNGGVHGTESTRIITDGQVIGIDITGTTTSVAGLAVTLWLKPLSRPVF